MPPKRSREELSEDEIRHILREKLRARHSPRLARFRRTGRAITLLPDLDSTPVQSFRTESTQEDGKKKSSLSATGKRLGDGLLFSFEVTIIVTLVLLLLNGTSLMSKLNQESVSSWTFPTLTPTPLIQAVVLPSGHTPPTSAGGTRPNEAEIPEHLRPLVQSLANIPIPTPAPQHGVRIQIPAIRVDAPIVQGDGWEQLKKGVAQRVGTANPGENGNMVLSGHNDVFGEVFRDLDQLKTGDEITVFTSQKTYKYVVTGWILVEPTQVEVMDPTPDPTLTLISCYPYLVDTQRIIVKGKLASS